MNMISRKRSPIQSWHESQGADTEQAACSQLTLRDMSGVPMLEVKGPGAAGWLQARDLPVPARIYAGDVIGENGWITRTGREEYLLRGAVGSQLPDLAEDVAHGVYRHGVLISSRQDALFLLTGQRIGELMAQSCGLDYAAITPRQTVLSRIAAVSCGLLKDQMEDNPVCWLWLDPSHGLYLWEQLVQIIQELDGVVVRG
jgi:sarcosine oxidase subunit gamma